MDQEDKLGDCECGDKTINGGCLGIDCPFENNINSSVIVDESNSSMIFVNSSKVKLINVVMLILTLMLSSILVLVVTPILLINPTQIQEVVILILIVALSSILVLILTLILEQVEFVKYVRLSKI